METDRIEKNVLLRASRSRVWRAITDSTEFGAWFGVAFEGPFVPGTPIKGKIAATKVDPEVAKQQEPYVGTKFEIVVEQIEPERLFSFRWHPCAIDPNTDYANEPTTLITFTLDDADGGVLLTLTESGFDKIPLERRAKAFEMNSHGWAAQMTLIEKFLALGGAD